MPCNEFVAGFIGSPQMNFVDATLVKKGDDVYFQFEENSIKVPSDKANAPELQEYIGQEVVAGLRPEAIHDEPSQLANNPDSQLDAYVDVTELMGAETYLYMNCEGQDINARVSPTNTAKPGDKIKIALAAEKIHLFDKDTEIVITN